MLRKQSSKRSGLHCWSTKVLKRSRHAVLRCAQPCIKWWTNMHVSLWASNFLAISKTIWRSDSATTVNMQCTFIFQSSPPQRFSRRLVALYAIRGIQQHAPTQQLQHLLWNSSRNYHFPAPPIRSSYFRTEKSTQTSQTSSRSTLMQCDSHQSKPGMRERHDSFIVAIMKIIVQEVCTSS